MFKMRKKTDMFPVFYQLQVLWQLIAQSDVSLATSSDDTQTQDGRVSRRNSPSNRSIFIQNLSELLEHGVDSHEGTKSNLSHAGAKTTHIKIPLCFLAARHSRPVAFNMLLETLGEDIHLLVDDYFQGNVLHHIYGKYSEANDDMINVVFDILEKHLSPAQILEMIWATDKNQNNVLWHAKQSDAAIGEDLFARNLFTRISAYNQTHVEENHHYLDGFGIFQSASSDGTTHQLPRRIEDLSDAERLAVEALTILRAVTI